MPPFVAHSPSQIVRGTGSVVIGSSGQVTVTAASGQVITLVSGAAVSMLTIPASGFNVSLAGGLTMGSAAGAVLNTSGFSSEILANQWLALGAGNLAGNGQKLGLRVTSELTTIAAAATTDTTIQIPADAIVIAVAVRVTVAIPTATAFDVGVSGATTRYGTGISTAANTTNKGTLDALRYYAAAIAIRITPDATPAANTGRVRVTIHYLDVTAPTS